MTKGVKLRGVFGLLVILVGILIMTYFPVYPALLLFPSFPLVVAIGLLIAGTYLCAVQLFVRHTWAGWIGTILGVGSLVVLILGHFGVLGWKVV